jgi:signal transduction histidine kinase
MTGRIEHIVGHKGSLQRQYAVAAALFGVLVLAIILVFGHLISRSLSRRYLEDLLISGREDAQRIASDLQPDDAVPLDVLVERREEMLRGALEKIDRRHVVERIEVTDTTGRVVFTEKRESTENVPLEVVGDLEIGDSLRDTGVVKKEESFQVRVPLGEVGEVVFYLSRARLSERVVRLRRELLAQTLGVAALTLTTLIIAFVFVWHLIQRTRRLETAKREAEEFAALGTLAANLAHEIRNPLNSINLNLELLEEDLTLAEDEARLSVATTRREVGRLAQLVSDFLTYARPTRPELVPLRVDRMLKDVREFLAAEARSMGVHLRLTPGLSEGSVLSDEAQLRQVMLNLVINAVQAVASLDPDRRIVELDAEDRGDMIALKIRDRGDGIPDEELEQVRRAFYTRRRGGTGLGLAIAERTVEAHGGFIELHNLHPLGFEAVVALPAAGRGGKMTG